MNPKKILIPKNESDSLFNLFFRYFALFRLSDGKIIAVNKKTREWIYVRKKEVICSKLRQLYYSLENQTVSKNTVNTTYDMIKSISDNCNDSIEFINILGQTETQIIFNINGTDSYVLIDKNSVKLEKKSKSKLIFNNISCHPIYPDINNVDNSKYFNYLQTLFNVDETQLILFGVYIVSLFIKNINHPLLLLSGDYGAAKTTTAKKIIKILNPDGNLTQMSKNIDDVAVLLSNEYLVGFDNVSKEVFTREMADLICSAVTGSTYQKRKLYTNDEISSLHIHNAIIVNGLDLHLPYNDLTDRSITINFKRIDDKNRLTEKQIWDEFYELLPKLQGCIFCVISKAMNTYNNTHLKVLPRLADFAQWGYAIAETIETGLGNEFLQQYFENIRASSMIAIDNDCLLSTLHDLMAEVDYWEGTATDLLTTLRNIYYTKNAVNILPKGFPLAANTLSRRLNSLTVELKTMGLSLAIGRDSNRYINITKIGGNTNE